MQERAAGDVTYVLVASPQPDGTNYGFVILAQFIPDNTNSFPWSGPLLSVTNVDIGGSVPFINGPTNPNIQVFGISAVVAPDVLSETFTLTWSNYSADFGFDVNPFFLVQPQGQSVFVGSNVGFSAQAFHTTGYQWQRDGTNLVEDGHFIGVTNSTLTISNAQIEDAGDYTVIANHPDNPIPSFDAILGVFKPIQLGLMQSSSDGSFQLQVGNQDSSPVDDSEVSHFTIYSTTDLSLSVSNWDVESVTGVLTNGIYLIPFPDDGSPARFWQVGQQP